MITILTIIGLIVVALFGWWGFAAIIAIGVAVVFVAPLFISADN